MKLHGDELHRNILKYFLVNPRLVSRETSVFLFKPLACNQQQKIHVTVFNILPSAGFLCLSGVFLFSGSVGLKCVKVWQQSVIVFLLLYKCRALFSNYKWILVKKPQIYRNSCLDQPSDVSERHCPVVMVFTLQISALWNSDLACFLLTAQRTKLLSDRVWQNWWTASSWSHLYMEIRHRAVCSSPDETCRLGFLSLQVYLCRPLQEETHFLVPFQSPSWGLNDWWICRDVHLSSLLCLQTRSRLLSSALTDRLQSVCRVDQCSGGLIHWYSLWFWWKPSQSLCRLLSLSFRSFTREWRGEEEEVSAEPDLQNLLWRLMMKFSQTCDLRMREVNFLELQLLKTDHDMNQTFLL